MNEDSSAQECSIICCLQVPTESNRGVMCMNCYICCIETGCESRPAVAICQHCGAGMCREHLVETIVPQIANPGSRAKLVCCRCHTSTVHSARPTRSCKQTKVPEGRGMTSRWNWLRRFGRSALPDPKDAVVAVEHFLNQRRNQ